MNIAKWSPMVGILLLASFFTVGCGDQDKKMIEQLKLDNEALKNQNAQYRDELNAAKEQENQLLAQLAQKDQDLANAQKAPKAPAAAAEGATATGWEKGLVGDKITIGSDILFKAGEAKLSDAGKSKLGEIVSQIKSNYAGLPVRVYGYTDNDPIFHTKNLWLDNLDLSANRAMAVTRYLWSKGIAKEHIETVAMGDTNFIASNLSKATKAKNRRVEIIVIKTGK